MDPPRSLMNSRRLIAASEAQDRASYSPKVAHSKGLFVNEAQVIERLDDVRFTPKSGHLRCKQECPLWAKSGHAPYSITSSARVSTAGGTVRPSALAVLRLIARSYLVGVCTGRSAGFSPLRMRST